MAGRVTPTTPAQRARWRDNPPTAPPPTSRATHRRPRPGERCGCGRLATIVFLTERNGEIPSCAEKPPRPPYTAS